MRDSIVHPIVPGSGALHSFSRGGRSSVGRAPGCGPGGRGFESRRSPLMRRDVARVTLHSMPEPLIIHLRTGDELRVEADREELSAAFAGQAVHRDRVERPASSPSSARTSSGSSRSARAAGAGSRRPGAILTAWPPPRPIRRARRHHARLDGDRRRADRHRPAARRDLARRAPLGRARASPATSSGIAGFARVICVDRRGVGLSDPVSGPITMEDECGDMLAVLDAAGMRARGPLRVHVGRAAVHPVRRAGTPSACGRWCCTRRSRATAPRRELRPRGRPRGARSGDRGVARGLGRRGEHRRLRALTRRRRTAAVLVRQAHAALVKPGGDARALAQHRAVRRARGPRARCACRR